MEYNGKPFRSHYLSIKIESIIFKVDNICYSIELSDYSCVFLIVLNVNSSMVMLIIMINILTLHYNK